MSARTTLSRRAFLGSLAPLALARAADAQGFAGLAGNADDFAQVVPGRSFAFPADHGPHPDFRLEWWYLTANLADQNGAAHGVQWTLFREALEPGPERDGWASRQIYMAHAAATRADTHRFSETFARGGVGQAGVDAAPFRAFIDSWQMQGSTGTDPRTIAPLDLRAAGRDFSYALTLDANRPLILEGDSGYSRKSARGQASYYYSQPFFTARGRLTIDDKTVEVSGEAWMDREWSSQPLDSDQTGWDWIALHLESGAKLMLYRMRQTSGDDFISGNLISKDGGTRMLGTGEVRMTPEDTVDIAGRTMPVRWQVVIPTLELAIRLVPLNPRAWMGTAVSYWEGPIACQGTHAGVGYLEMTGY